jgi:hypothetical protein
MWSLNQNAVKIGAEPVDISGVDSRRQPESTTRRQEGRGGRGIPACVRPRRA